MSEFSPTFTSMFLFLFLVLDSLFKQPKILLPLLPKYQPSYENHHQPAYAFHSQEIFTTDQPFYTPEYLCILCRKQEGMPGLRKEIQKAPSLWQDCQTRQCPLSILPLAGKAPPDVAVPENQD